MYCSLLFRRQLFTSQTHQRIGGAANKKKNKKTEYQQKTVYDDTLGQLGQHGKKMEIDLEIDEMNKLLLNNDAYVK